MRFRRQLVAGHVALLFVTIVTGSVAIIALRTTSSRLGRVGRDLASDMMSIQRLRFQAEQVVAASRGYLLTGEPARLGRFSDAVVTFDHSLARIEPAAGAEDVKAAANAYVAAASDVARRRTSAGNLGEVLPFFEDTVTPLQRRFETAIGEFVQRERDAFRAASIRAGDFADRTQGTVALTTLLGVVISLGLAWLSIRRLGSHYDREQRATESARRAIGARDELLAVVSHDLRTPLATISLGAELLQDTTGDPRTRKHVTAIGNAARLMQGLIEELLDIARIEAGTFELRREPCAVAGLLDTTSSLFGARAIEAGIELVVDVTDEPPPAAVLGDRERIIQILSNLVGNAFKFTPAGGRVVVTVRRDRDAVRFAVTDTGPGIPAEQVPHLFERYWQGRPRGRGSLGLGLYICKRLVEAHHGEIGVETKPGAGSTFWFTLAAA